MKKGVCIPKISYVATWVIIVKFRINWTLRTDKVGNLAYWGSGEGLFIFRIHYKTQWEVHCCEKRGECVGKTKCGKSLKLMVITEKRGSPVSVLIARASQHEVCLVEPTFNVCIVSEGTGGTNRRHTENSYNFHINLLLLI